MESMIVGMVASKEDNLILFTRRKHLKDVGFIRRFPTQDNDIRITVTPHEKEDRDAIVIVNFYL